jgi:hypothetical protein
MCMIHTSLQAANNIRMWQKSHTPRQKSIALPSPKGYLFDIAKDTRVRAQQRGADGANPSDEDARRVISSLAAG